MWKSVSLLGTLALLLVSTSASYVDARDLDLTLAVTMTNDATSNQIKVYDASTGALLQTLGTKGKGGVTGNARGVKQFDGQLFAAVNNGSGNVALFKRTGNRLMFDKVVTTTSAPVSVDFSSDHMYVVGATTVDSFVLHHDNVGQMDGTTALVLSGGGVPPAGQYCASRRCR